MNTLQKITLGALAAGLVYLGSGEISNSVKYSRLFNQADVTLETGSLGIIEKLGGFCGENGEIDRIIVEGSSSGIAEPACISYHLDLTKDDRVFSHYKSFFDKEAMEEN